MTDLEIFQNAPENASPGELAAYIDEACGGDSELRAKVEALFAMQGRTDDFLEEAPVDLDAPTIAFDGQSSDKESPTPREIDSSPKIPTEQAGDVIGNYTLIEKLGEGGFGTVWKADQRVPIARTVALKIIKLGMDTEEVITRFEAERQALAMMDHPNIAKVHDAGTTETGRPYFVMELVDGTPLTEYCDAQKLNLNDRLDLFTQVCAGVQHAHQKGIIHRDLKPPNVLVVEHDGKPVPKVIDFGIAKAIGQDLTENTLQTMAGQIMGTPVYMSPEQASGAVNADIDTRSDVYSLGVILYELLSGRPPFGQKELREAGWIEMERIIREVEPRKLSSQIVNLAEADQTTIALARDTQPVKLARSVRGDLEWVVMKALSKERERRYGTAKEFAKDVQHYLHHEPVEAGPPTAIYRMKRYARKHRRPLAAAALFVFGLLALTAWALSERDNAFEQTRVARIEEGKAWMERASYYKERPGQEFYAALMAARAIGFDGFRSPDTDKPFPFPVLFERGTSDYAAAQREVQLFCRHPRPIWRAECGAQAIAYSPDGQTLASGNNDRTIKVWNLDKGGEPQTLTGHSMVVRSVAFSPDGRTLASGSDDHSIKLWDLEKGGEPQTLSGHSGAVFSVAFSFDGRTVASSSYDRTIKLWDIEKGGEPQTLSGHSGMVKSVAFSPDGRTLASGGIAIKLWDLEKGGEPRTLRHLTGVRSVAFSPDGRTLASSSNDKTIKLWDLEKGDEPQIFSGHSLSVSSVAFSPDGRTLASSSNDKTIKLWDLEKGGEPQTLSGDSSMVFSVAFSPGGLTLASCSNETIQLWDLKKGGDLQAFTDHSGSVYSVAFSPDGRTLASSSIDKSIKLWDLKSGGETQTLSGHTAGVGSVAFSPDGRTLASGSRDATIKLWDLEKGGEPQTLSGHRSTVNVIDRQSFEPVYSVAFSPDGRTLASGSYNETIKLWDIKKGGEPQTLSGHAAGVGSVAFSPNGRTLASGNNDNTVNLWDLEKGGEPQILSGHSMGVKSVAFSPDGWTLASGGNDNTIKLWDLEKGGEPQTLTGHSMVVRSVAFSPDGRTLASGSDDKTIKLWDLEKGGEPQTLTGHSSTVMSVAFSPDGHTLASGSADQITKLWDLKFLFDPEFFDLAAYVTAGWLEMNGREVTWTTAEDDPNSEPKFSFLNVPENCLIAMHQRGALPEEFLWQYFRARNWNAVLDRFRDVEDPVVKKEAARHLIRWLRLDAEKDAITPGLSEFRLGQLRELLEQTDQESDAFQEMQAKVVDIGSGVDRRLAAMDTKRPEDSSHAPLGTHSALRTAALQVWFGKDAEHTATSQTLMKSVRERGNHHDFERVAKLSCLRPFSDETTQETVLALAQRALGEDKDNRVFQSWAAMTLGMAEYRAGHYAESGKILATITSNTVQVESTAGFYRAMSLFQQGEQAAARKLFTAAEAKMTPLPGDEKNPLAGNANHDDLVMWLAYKEAKALLEPARE